MTQDMMGFGSSMLLAMQIGVLFVFVRHMRQWSEFQDERTKKMDRILHLSNVIMKDRLKFRRKIEDRTQGVVNKATLKAKTAEVLAERAFNLASSANLAIMALQRTLTVRSTYVPKKKQLENEVAQENVMKILGGTSDYSGFDWLRPILGPDEIDIIDKAMDHAERYKNGEKES